MKRLSLTGRAAAGREALRWPVFDRWWDTLAEPLLSVLFPPRCVGCGDFETHLCDKCKDALEGIGPEACPRCGEPGPRPLLAGRCSACLGREVSYVRARSAFVHSGAAQRLVLELKSGGQKLLARTMAALAGPAFSDFMAATPGVAETLVTWVPSHPAVLRRRGYNQAELLARELAAGASGLALAGLLEKRVHTREQKALDKTARQGNLRGAFSLVREAWAALEGGPRALVLVDDVLTTGATAEEVSMVLTEGTGLPVHVFTFSRAVSGREETHD